LEIDKEKMSKSLGNFFTIKEVLGRYDPMALRFFLVYTHYRSPIDFSDAAMDEATASYGRLKKFHRMLNDVVGEIKDGVIPEFGAPDDDVLKLAFSIKKEFTDAMDDDFNTRIAVSTLFKLDSEVKELQRSGKIDQKNAFVLLSVMDELTGILGLEFIYKETNIGGELAEGLVQILIDLRKKARDNKEWATADLIRDRLKELGIILEDGETTTWKLT
jgi:cysteinyl-tRNA synthetase